MLDLKCHYGEGLESFAVTTALHKVGTNPLK